MLKRTSFKVVLTYNMNVVICDDQRFFVNQLEGKLKNYSSRKDLNLRQYRTKKQNEAKL